MAEGAGEFSPEEKRRFYRMARRSATERAAIIESRRGHAPAEATGRALGVLGRIVAMLVRMSKG